MTPPAAVELVSGAASVGQGVETVLAQICAEALGVDYADIRVVRGRTDRIEFGNGAHASRVTVMSGSATWHAALAVRRHGAGDRGRAAAGQAGGSSTIIDGQVVRPDGSGTAIALAEVARHMDPTRR